MRAGDELAAAVTREHGKVLDEREGRGGAWHRGMSEPSPAASRTPEGLRRTRTVSTGIDIRTVLEPLGVVAGITPFNFPIMVPLWMMANAIACGNAFVLKPSEKDPSASLVLADLVQRAGFADGVFQRGAGRP